MGGLGDGMPQAGQLHLLLLVASPPTLAFGPLVRQVLRIAAAKANRAVQRRIQIDEVGAHRIEEGAVVAGQDDGTGQVAELLGEKLRRLVIEVVGRLVEQQRGRASDQQNRKRQAAALAAGQSPQLAIVGQLPQPEAVEDDRGAAVRIPRVLVLRVLEPLAVLREEVPVVWRLRQLTRQAVEFGEVLAGVSQRVVEEVGQRRLTVEGQFLLEKPQLSRPYDGTAVRLVQTGEQLEQGRLPDAVLPDQPDPVPGRRGERYSVQDSPGAKRADQILGDHRRSLDSDVSHGRELRSPGAGRPPV
jgi:hypothetical protein